MKTQRLRDPIHDLIVFDENSDVDRVAWRLLNEREFQRLRRVRQLGVSEFVYASATHTRFAHSVGVFHNARRLLQIIHREIDLHRVAGDYDEGRAKTCLMAALLHDIGHGPFSHAFEEARKSIAEHGGDSAAKIKKHEGFTADMIIAADSNIRDILAEIGVSADEVGELLRAENPIDMYHSIVSSSFDADRLDYLQRDRYMTGTGAGAIDIGWLMDNVRVAEIDVSPPEEGGNGEGIYIHGFCLSHKARDAAEDFLLSRYRLYSNVYFHKTTRGMEQLVSAFFRRIAEKLTEGRSVAGLSEENVLCRFFSPGGDSLQNYRLLDDTVVLSAIQQVAWFGEDAESDIAKMFLSRTRPWCIDVQHEFPQQTEEQRKLKHQLGEKI